MKKTDQKNNDNSHVKGVGGIKGIDPSDLDVSVRPQDDFYQFANGGWMAGNPIPSSEAMWGSFYMLRDDNLHALHVILEDLSKKPDGELDDTRAKLRDFYTVAMDEEKAEHLGAQPLAVYQKEIDAIRSSLDLQKILTRFHERGVDTFWRFSIEPDEKDSETEMIHLYQGGIGMPDRDYYLNTDARSQDLRKQYAEYVSRIFVLLGKDEEEASEAARAVLSIETELARASMTRVERRDIEKQYNKMTVGELAKRTPNIEWRAYFEGIGAGGVGDIIVGQPKFFEKVSEMLDSVSLSDWKTYMQFCLVNTAAPFLSSVFVNERFQFYGKILSGAQELKPRWKRVIGSIDTFLGEALGELYVRKHFSPEAKSQVNEMVDHLKEAYARRITELDWMSEETKKQALVKLASMGRKIGYPEKWRDYSGLEIGTDSYFANVIRAEEFEWKRNIAKLGKPVEKSEWHMPPQIVNAYYDAQRNEIAFPAGILQPPFFDPHIDPAINYGCIGMVIGHELTHGFDDQGAQFDEKGNFNNWWSEEDNKKFNERTKKIVEEFSGYKVFDDLSVNGDLTQGENIADLGGALLAYHAYQRYLEHHGRPESEDEFSPEKRFFLGFAVFERENRREEIARQLIMIDPHSPPKFRINAPLSNMQEFHDAYKLVPTDKMYRDEKDRVKIW